jgi:peroxiredoxin
MTDTTPADPARSPGPRKPRKIFLLIGVVLAAALGVGLFTSLGTPKSGSGAPPRVGGPVPIFTASNVNGAGDVQQPADPGDGHPAVMLFFGNWCQDCHAELPSLAAVVRHQQAAHGALSGISVIGVDSLDSVGRARSFIHSSGVTFPVAYDPNGAILSGAFYFEGDPNAVFINRNGTINRIVRGDVLTAASFTADEDALIPSGR